MFKQLNATLISVVASLQPAIAGMDLTGSVKNAAGEPVYGAMVRIQDA